MIVIAFLFYSSSLLAVPLDLKSKRIGILNKFDHKAVLAYQPSPRPIPGSEKFEIIYYAVPEWGVMRELNNLIIRRLQTFDRPPIIDLNYKSIDLKNGLYIEGENLGKKYIEKLTTSPEIKDIDYLLIIVPTGNLDGVSTPIPLFNLSVSNDERRAIQYGFVSGYNGGVRSFFSAAYLLFDFESKKIILRGDASQTQVFGYKKKLAVSHRKHIYKTVKRHISDQEYLHQIRNLIIHSALTESDKNEIRRIFKNALSQAIESEDDLNDLMLELDHAMLTNIITPIHFSESVTQKRSQAFDSQIQDLQRLAAEQIVRQIESMGR